MLTILNAVELSTDYLNSKGVESPRLNAEILLANILDCKRMDLYLKFDQPLTKDETTKYRESISRRGKREPLQYIIGKVEFYGLDFLVNPNVLIPRQETEILIDTVLSQVDKEIKLGILDIGTGSGNITISLLKHLPNSIFTSLDKSEEAIKTAKNNAILNGLENNIDFIIKDFNNYELNGNEKFDVIVSNPPYIKLQEYSTLDKELLNYEPKDALTDNNDGFSFYKLISEKADSILNEKGKIFFEVGINQAEKVREIMVQNNFSNIKFAKDYLGINRVVYGEKN
ncbi:MAG: peptide chain release factor N(5)-glutamine methyltransferase [Ignavibacteriae bacterium]|nr:peptide chain release factor N(5)-glutamine methyltransferase [Ignavibacteriota bacterium]